MGDSYQFLRFEKPDLAASHIETCMEENGGCDYQYRSGDSFHEDRWKSCFLARL